MNQDEMKRAAAEAALSYVEEDTIIGIGTGSTTNFFIDALMARKHKIEGTVASSVASSDRLKALGIPVYELTAVNQIHLYVDGADETNQQLQLIKGGGGALTREKILAANSNKFVCIVDESKMVSILGKSFPIPVEVIPMARSYVARQIVKLGGDPNYRENFITDNGNVILDIYNLPVHEPIKLEHSLNNITGVVCNGIFAQRPANVLLMANKHGIETLGSIQ